MQVEVVLQDNLYFSLSGCKLLELAVFKWNQRKLGFAVLNACCPRKTLHSQGGYINSVMYVVVVYCDLCMSQWTSAGLCRQDSVTIVVNYPEKLPPSHMKEVIKQ